MSWFFFAIVAGVLFGIEPLISKTVINGGFTSFHLMMYYFTVGTVVFWIYALAADKVIMPVYFGQWVKIAVIALLIVFGTWLLLESYRLVDNTGFVRAVVSINIIVAFVLTNILFGAKVSFIGIVGVLLIVAGTIVISLK